MAIDLELSASSVEVSGWNYGEVKLQLKAVEISSIIDAVGEEKIYPYVSLDEYIDWACSRPRLPDILERLNPEEVIGWLRENGHLEAS